ncbi:hypothetical protein VTO73DRAFT_13871 [Trametes versicolor]
MRLPSAKYADRILMLPFLKDLCTSARSTPILGGFIKALCYQHEFAESAAVIETEGVLKAWYYCTTALSTRAATARYGVQRDRTGGYTGSHALPKKVACEVSLVIWHHLLTFDKEVEFFWRRKLNGPCALFLATGYSTLSWSIYDASWFPIDIAWSKAELWSEEVYMTADPHGRRVCVIAIDKLRLSDVIVLGVTWSVTHAYRSRDILRGFGRTKTLAGVMYKNGAIYFVVLTALNMLYLVVILLENTQSGGAREPKVLFADFIGITSDSFTTILVAHFLVRLQEAVRPATDSVCPEGGVPEVSRTLRFARADVDSWVHGAVESCAEASE